MNEILGPWDPVLPGSELRSQRPRNPSQRQGLPCERELLEKPMVSIDFATESLFRALWKQEPSKRALARARTKKSILGTEKNILA